MRRHHFYIYTLFISLPLISACGPLPQKSDLRKPIVQHSPQKVAPVLKRAKAMLGKPYRYGGRSPRHGFDCSGLVYYSFAYRVPRSSRAQYRRSKAVSRHRLRPGDLVFFKLNFSKVSHVGIYLGRHQFIHAPSTGKSVMLSSLREKYWSRRFVRGGRFSNLIN